MHGQGGQDKCAWTRCPKLFWIHHCWIMTCEAMVSQWTVNCWMKNILLEPVTDRGSVVLLCHREIRIHCWYFFWQDNSHQRRHDETHRCPPRKGLLYILWSEIKEGTHWRSRWSCQHFQCWKSRCCFWEKVHHSDQQRVCVSLYMIAGHPQWKGSYWNHGLWVALFWVHANCIQIPDCSQWTLQGRAVGNVHASNQEWVCDSGRGSAAETLVPGPKKDDCFFKNWECGPSSHHISNTVPNLCRNNQWTDHPCRFLNQSSWSGSVCFQQALLVDLRHQVLSKWDLCCFWGSWRSLASCCILSHW